MDNYLFRILMKLKLGASNQDLSLKVNVKQECVSKIVRTWLPKLVNAFAKLIIRRERQRERQRDREKQGETERQRDRDRERERESQIWYFVQKVISIN